MSLERSERCVVTVAKLQGVYALAPLEMNFKPILALAYAYSSFDSLAASSL